jgi:molybdopterin molybdotransferase
MPSFSIDDAQLLIRETMRSPQSIERIDLSHALGRSSARDISATEDQPRFDAAAMDGWAVSDTPSIPYVLVGESRAGSAYQGILQPGEAVTISTGAPIPAGSTALVRREQGKSTGRTLIIENYQPGRDIRCRGSDFRCGDMLLPTGKPIDHLDIARMAASGIAQLDVWRRPTLAILATGDEIMPAGSEPRAGGTYDSLSPALLARLSQIGTAATHLGIARDDKHDIARRIESAGADIFIIIGGSANGRHDRVRSSLTARGLSILLPSVNMRPGKPFWFGRFDGDRFVFGLPGNPIAALAAVELFIIPALRAMQGLPSEPEWITLPTATIPGMAGHDRVSFARMTVAANAALQVQPLGGSDSAALAPISGANALLRHCSGEGTNKTLLLPLHSWAAGPRQSPASASRSPTRLIYRAVPDQILSRNGGGCDQTT